MKFQLVLQIPASSIKDYDDMIKLEATIAECLGSLGELDGHDAGSSEMNIFIHTDRPRVAFEKINRRVGTKDFMPDLKVAYRSIDGDVYTILHPAGLSEFKIA